MPIMKPKQQQKMQAAMPVKAEESDMDDAAEQGETPDAATEQVRVAGYKVLYDDSAHGDFINQLKMGADDPAAAIAAVTFTLMQSLDDKAGGKIPEDALVSGALLLLEEVAKLASVSKALPVNESILPAATQQLFALAIENGIIDAEDIQAMMDGMPPEEIQRIVAEQEQITGGRNQMAGVA